MLIRYTAMGHTLFPNIDDQYLQPEEIVRRLRAEFEYVDADPEEGMSYLLEMIDRFEKMTPEMAQMYQRVNLDVPTHIQSLRSMLGKAIYIVVSDRSDFQNDYIRFVAMPDTAPLIGYSSGEHEDAAAPLLKRMCGILGYRAELI
jgi:hypothetical protein